MSAGGGVKCIIINGKNLKNYNKINKYIKKYNITNILNLGFVNNIENYMRASDLIITKCGSSCLTECISLKIPFIMREKMILNEELNKKLFISLGCGIGMNKITDVSQIVDYIFTTPQVYQSMINNISKIQCRYAPDKITKLLIDKYKERNN